MRIDVNIATICSNKKYKDSNNSELQKHFNVTQLQTFVKNFRKTMFIMDNFLHVTVGEKL